MKRPLTPLLLLAFFFGINAGAQTPTWSQNVAPILYNNCATCHHSGAIAPFALMTYADAVTNAGSMKADVMDGSMPPWPPDPKFSRMAHERLLSQTDKNTIAAWVDGGTPQGNAALAPPTPTFSNTGELPGTPDMVLKIPPYTSTASTNDVYRCFVLNTGLTNVDRYITAFEAIPGNRGIVHHVLVFADTTGVSTQLDAADPGPGYTNFGGIGTNNAILLGGWVPGSSPLQYPNGFGVMLPHNAKVVLQIHYPQGTAGQVDSTEIHLFFSPVTATVRPITILPVLSHETDITPTLFIPANTTATFTEAFTAPLINYSVLGVAPHMHLIGQSIKSYGITPANDTLNFINIPKWDFHWQGFYLFKKFMKVPPNTVLHASAFYDNTVNNPDNPSSPPKDVSAGEQTTDEMMLVFFVFTPYQAGDENIVIDSTVSVGVPNYTYYNGEQLLQPYPVPASNELVVKYYFDKAGTASLELVNAAGQVVQKLMNSQQIAAGYGTKSISVASVASGIYTLRMQTSEGIQTKQITVQH